MRRNPWRLGEVTDRAALSRAMRAPVTGRSRSGHSSRRARIHPASRTPRPNRTACSRVRGGASRRCTAPTPGPAAVEGDVLAPSGQGRSGLSSICAHRSGRGGRPGPGGTGGCGGAWVQRGGIGHDRPGRGRRRGVSGTMLIKAAVCEARHRHPQGPPRPHLNPMLRFRIDQNDKWGQPARVHEHPDVRLGRRRSSGPRRRPRRRRPRAGTGHRPHR